MSSRGRNVRRKRARDAADLGPWFRRWPIEERGKLPPMKGGAGASISAERYEGTIAYLANKSSKIVVYFETTKVKIC